MPHRIHDLKKVIFDHLLDMAGRVFIVARYSDRVVVGTRGFTQEEMKNGIVLVFNPRMTYSWDDGGISATLVFGTSPQRCYVPSEDIVAIYSPELQAQFVIAPSPAEGSPEGETPTEKNQQPSSDSKIVRVDFQKRKGKKQ